MTMAAVFPQTPQRPLPGGYTETPAPQRPAQPDFQVGAYRPTKPSNALVQQNGQPSQTPAKITPTERAARTINDTLAEETRYPELNTYLAQGHSSEYEIRGSPAWEPFAKTKVYNIPDAIFEQYNRAQVSTSMGLFAEIHYAWVAIDNALYMWDYTVQNPELLGFEEQPSSITAVKLGIPRVGVFLPTIRHIIILATTSEIILLGLGTEQNAGGLSSLNLFSTGMTVSVKGLDVSVIANSATTGRIFFGGRSENEVYELTYQQEEKWFSSRCAKVCHTSGVLASFAPFTLSSRQLEHVEQMIIDDSRSLLYTLSSQSAIRVFHISENGGLTLAITKAAADVFSNIGHVVAANESLNARTKIISISPVSAAEDSKYHLIATTSTGYRIYLSATRSNSWSTNSSQTPVSMQALHVKVPPPATRAQTTPSTTIQQCQNVNAPVQSLSVARKATRYAPGYFFCFVSEDPNSPSDSLFVSCPDPGRLFRPQENGQPSRTAESALWLSLGSRVEDIGVSTAYAPPFTRPQGYGNELCVQFDKPSAEVAILTNTGVHVVRRRRLVDIFAAIIQNAGGSEGFETEVRNFIRNYGRTETLATALAAACGQGLDVAQNSSAARISDPQVLDVARRVYIDYGGKPTISQNSIAEQPSSAIETVRPSPRHQATALYLTRIIYSTWRNQVCLETRTPNGGYTVTSAVPIIKIRTIQDDLMGLQRFLNTNKAFIQGLTGPDLAARTTNKQDEIAMQGEHRALQSLLKFIQTAIEGLSFIQVLFEERVEEIVPLLSEQSRPIFLRLTFEELFSSQRGFDLAKELVKAIVNRNIAKGSNVETVAEALRRKCGSFCSADDVQIFKAQEFLKRAGEADANADFARNLLNESLSLFKNVAENLPQDYLENAVNQYIQRHFFAGAVQLCLKVASDVDKAGEAALWVADGSPEGDEKRKSLFLKRQRCYNLIHLIVKAVDQSTSQEPSMIDGRPTLSATRRNEAYDVINQSTEELFLTNLFDWYLAEGMKDRLLAADSTFVVTYLKRKSKDDIAHADLLWQYYGQANQFTDAAAVQLQLAQSSFLLPLGKRIEYLSRARANASTYTPGTNRKSKQKLLQEIGEHLDVASVQDEVLQKLRSDRRLDAGGPERKAEVLKELDGPILTINDVGAPI